MRKATLMAAISGTLVGTAVSSTLICKRYKEKIEQINTQNRKWAEFYDLLLLWLELRQKGKSLQEYFSRKPYKTVAVYGMKELGERLCDELDSLGIEITYLIDRNAEIIYTDKVVYKPDDELPEVDIIIVTAIHYYGEIEEQLSTKVSCPIVNLTDIIYEAMSSSIV